MVKERLKLMLYWYLLCRLKTPRIFFIFSSSRWRTFDEAPSSSWRVVCMCVRVSAKKATEVCFGGADVQVDKRIPTWPIEWDRVGRNDADQSRKLRIRNNQSGGLSMRLVVRACVSSRVDPMKSIAYRWRRRAAWLGWDVEGKLCRLPWVLHWSFKAKKSY